VLDLEDPGAGCCTNPEVEPKYASPRDFGGGPESRLCAADQAATPQRGMRLYQAVGCARVRVQAAMSRS